MSTLVFMKVLESSPSRYDKGISLITFGKILPLYESLTSSITPDNKVLDIGCGTGLLSFYAAKNGASVKGIDINSDMLEIAEKRKQELNLKNSVIFEEKGVAELDKEPDRKYNWILAGMVFSELEDYEQEFTIKQVKRVLAPGGSFVIVDEVLASNPLGRIFQFIIRIPLNIITYIFTQTTTHTVKNLEEKLVSHGFVISDQGYSMFSSLKWIICTGAD